MNLLANASISGNRCAGDAWASGRRKEMDCQREWTCGANKYGVKYTLMVKRGWYFSSWEQATKGVRAAVPPIKWCFVRHWSLELEWERWHYGFYWTARTCTHSSWTGKLPYTRTHTHTQTRTRITCIHTHAHAYTQHTHTRMHPHAYTHARIFIHTLMHTRIHERTHAWVWKRQHYGCHWPVRAPLEHVHMRTHSTHIHLPMQARTNGRQPKTRIIHEMH